LEPPLLDTGPDAQDLEPAPGEHRLGLVAARCALHGGEQERRRDRRREPSSHASHGVTALSHPDRAVRPLSAAAGPRQAGCRARFAGQQEEPCPRPQRTPLYKLAELVKPKRIVPTQLEIVDIAGLVKGASKGEGLGNKFLANIREVDAIIHVVRCFEDENVIREEGPVNPVTDKEVIETELQLKDLESVEKKFENTERQARIDPTLKAELDVLQRCREHLELGKNIRDLGITKEERPAIADLFLLTEKPVLYVANVEEASMHRGNKFSDMMKGIAKKEKTEVIIMSNSIEAQIAEMEDAEDRKHFMEEYGMKEPALDR
jgi:GTP-binding protein YchF